jgi:hypothetical protein
VKNTQCFNVQAGDTCSNPCALVSYDSANIWHKTRHLSGMCPILFHWPESRYSWNYPRTISVSIVMNFPVQIVKAPVSIRGCGYRMMLSLRKHHIMDVYRSIGSGLRIRNLSSSSVSFPFRPLYSFIERLSSVG